MGDIPTLYLHPTGFDLKNILSVKTPITSFVLAGLSVTQLIFMAETGVLIHRSKIPLPIRYLAIVFLIRTAIALPILVTIAHLIADKPI